MRGAAIAMVIVVVAAVLAYGTFAGTYNRLVQSDQQVKAAQAEVET